MRAPAAATDSRPAAASRSAYPGGVALAVGGVGECGLNVFRGQFGEVRDDLGGGHAAGEPLQHVVHGDAQATDAWLAATLARLQGDPVAVVRHGTGSRTGQVG